MNTQLLSEWLKEFEGIANEWFTKNTFVKDRYDFFTQFFSKVRENGFNDSDEFFQVFDKLCDNIHSLNSNKLALARAKAKNERRESMEDYLTKFQHLIDINIDVEKRFEDALSKGKYGLDYFGVSSISELIGYNEPKKFTFLNQREKQAIKFLNIKLREKKTGKYYTEFNEIVKKEVLIAYCKVIYPHDSIASLTDNPDKLLSKTTLMLEIDQFFSWVFETKDESKNIYKVVESAFIDKINISNFYSIKEEIELSGLRNKKFIFLLGENGCGKTILLKAILIILKRFYIETLPSKETGVIEDIFKENKNFSLEAIGYPNIEGNQTNDFSIKEDFTESTLSYLKNLYAYGTHRSKVSADKAELYGFLTLFEEDQFLKNSETWLQKMRFAELENKNNHIKIKDIEHILANVLDIEKLNLTVTSEKVSFNVESEDYTLNQLSEGYRSVIIFLIDLLARLMENNPTIVDTKQFKAVVLIDELDMYLHPTWQKDICSKLSKLFPQIQFFISTHSPILVLGAPKKDTIIFRLTNENNETKVTTSYTGTQIETWLPNILISSPLFSTDIIDPKYKEILQELRTDDTFEDMLKSKLNMARLREKELALELKYREKIKNKEL